MAETVRSVANIDQLERILEFVRSCAARAGFSGRRIIDLELAVEEAMVNICRYAYMEHSGEVEVVCLQEPGGILRIEIVDRGRPFNLLKAEKPVFECDIARRQLGGLGIHIIRNMVDDIRYRREGGKNRLTLVLHDRKQNSPSTPDPVGPGR
jgi:anti-sigma regulatory factor (Ser/Thr protein kinase)